MLFSNNYYRNIILFILVSMGSVAIAACSKTVENGSVDFLTTGMTKNQVVEVLRKNSVRDVQPVLEKVITVRKLDKKNTEKLRDSEGLIISDNKGYAIKIIFVEDKVAKYYVSVPARNEGFSKLAVGTGRDRVMLNAKKLLEENPELSITSYLPTERLSLSDDSSVSTLLKYDKWHFNKSNSYSVYEVVFRNNLLKKIYFKWVPIELP